MAPVRFVRALWRHHPWVIWSGIWTLLLVLTAIAVNNLIDPGSSQQTPDLPSTPGLSPPLPPPSPELNSPLWLFFALILSCGAVSLALSQQLSRRTTLARKQRLQRKPGEAIAPYFPEISNTSDIERFVKPAAPQLPQAPQAPLSRGLPPAYGLRRSDHMTFPLDYLRGLPSSDRAAVPPTHQSSDPPIDSPTHPSAPPPQLPAESRPPFVMPQESRLRDLDRHAPGLAELLNIQQKRRQQHPPPEHPKASSE
ncbi:MAG: hypothetical protein AAFY26_09400 [Cyanobacteria bacterium J06638_22]